MRPDQPEPLMEETLAISTLAPLAFGSAAVLALPRLWRRLCLSRAKHRSLAGHSRMAQRLARLLPGYAYDEARFSPPMARRRTGSNAAEPLSSACAPSTPSAMRGARR